MADGSPAKRDFTNTQLSLALQEVEALRRAGHRHVSISSENPNSIGKPGVDAIKNGKTPDGHSYDWSKAGRAGAIKQSSDAIPTNENAKNF